jgi:uncharacterized protein
MNEGNVDYHGNPENAWINTYSGGIFTPLNAHIEDINVLDIAHSLSMQCRWNGHCRKFYSVAEHSVYVSRLSVAYLPPILLNDFKQSTMLYGLMHDATEAYLTDIPRPIKPFLKNYKEIEDRLHSVINERYSINTANVIQKAVKEADNALLWSEREALMNKAHSSWGYDSPPEYKMSPHEIKALPPEEAKNLFLETFNGLYK